MVVNKIIKYKNKNIKKEVRLPVTVTTADI